jgi:putative transposase
MPRQPRSDLPGLLRHVITRGIERREVLGDDRKRQTFVGRGDNRDKSLVPDS